MSVMPKEPLSIKEIEELGYYDFMGYMEVPFFNIGGGVWGGGELEGPGEVQLRLRGQGRRTVPC